MRWGKIVLLFQAITTLIIGIIFLSQLFLIGTSEVVDLNNPQERSEVTAIQSNFILASYMLFIVSLAEIIIVVRHLR